MLSWILQITIMSILIIVLVHHLLTFFKNTLTVPKIKDLVNRPTLQYETIYHTIHHENAANSNSSKPESVSQDYTLIDLLPSSEQQTPANSTMKHELKEFLKSQLRD